jgi:hypothetical protein
MTQKVGGAKMALTFFSSAFCAVHWLITHEISIYLLPGAVLFGVIATTLTVWFLDPPSTPSSDG